MQTYGISHNSALQTLQSLINTIENPSNAAANSTAAAGQNVPGASAGSDQPTLPPPPPSSFSDQFAPASLAFLTSLQSSSGSGATASLGATSLAGLNQGLADLSSALKEIQNALTASVPQTQSSAAAALTSTSSTGAASLTGSVLATVLNELSAVLNGLDQSAGTAQGHRHHHHHPAQGPASDSASANGTATTASASSSSATTTGASTTG